MKTLAMRELKDLPSPPGLPVLKMELTIVNLLIHLTFSFSPNCR